MSLNPPLNPFAKGVRIARVITTSSAFLEVLRVVISMCLYDAERRGSYIVDNPEEPGVKCLRIELSLSVILRDLRFVNGSLRRG